MKVMVYKTITKFYFLIILISGIYSGNNIRAQAMIFPGSEWHHMFSESFWNQNIGYTHTKNIQDTLIGADTFSVLQCSIYSSTGSYYNHRAFLLKSDSDRVFFYQPDSGMALMYDFSAQQGDKWEVYIPEEFGNKIIKDTFIVDSVATIHYNGYDLRQLYLRLKYNFLVEYFYNPVTERLGSLSYIFPWQIQRATDGPVISHNCYEDTTWPLTKRLSISCKSLYINRDEEVHSPFIKIYPDAYHHLRYHIQFNYASENWELGIYNTSGQAIARYKPYPGEEIFSFDFPGNGIYYGYVTDKGRLVQYGKIPVISYSPSP